MPHDASHPNGAMHTIRTRSVTRRVRVAPGLPLWVSLFLLPLLLSLAAVFLFHGSAEDNLRDRVDRQVIAAGYSSVNVSVSGRDVVAHVARAADEKAVKKTIEGIDGVRTVEVER